MFSSLKNFSACFLICSMTFNIYRDFSSWARLLIQKIFNGQKNEKTNAFIAVIYNMCRSLVSKCWTSCGVFYFFFTKDSSFLLSFYTRGKESNGILLCLCLLYLIIYIIQFYDNDISKFIAMHTNCNLVAQLTCQHFRLKLKKTTKAWYW